MNGAVLCLFAVALALGAPLSAQAQSAIPRSSVSACQPAAPQMSEGHRVGMGTAFTVGGGSLFVLGAVGLGYAATSNRSNDHAVEGLATAMVTTGLVAGGALAALGIYALSTPSLSRPGEVPADCRAGLGPGTWLWPAQGLQ